MSNETWPIILFLLGCLVLPPLSVYYVYKTGTSPFIVGDSVKAFGNTGTVKSISANGMFLEVQFPEAQATTVFTICGRVHAWNKRPSLEKV